MGCVQKPENFSLNKEEFTKEDLFFLKQSFASHLNHCIELFVVKNERYEASFFKQCGEDNDLSSAVVRLKDKVNRITTLVKNPDINPSDESIKDTLEDLANYAIMSLVFLDCLEKGQGDNIAST